MTKLRVTLSTKYMFDDYMAIFLFLQQNPSQHSKSLNCLKMINYCEIAFVNMLDFNYNLTWCIMHYYVASSQIQELLSPGTPVRVWSKEIVQSAI